MKIKIAKILRSNVFYAVLSVGVLATLGVLAWNGYQSGVAKEKEAQRAAQFSEADGALEEPEKSVAANNSILGESNVAAADETDSSKESARVDFDSTQTMSWPVDGDVLMTFSMDKTVYFKTLDQYKCNDALLIAKDTGTPVSAAFDGHVTEVFTDHQRGTVVEVDMGNGYKAYYGQLSDVSVAPGDGVSKGDILGKITEPTKYYEEEGSHLYFKVTKDETAVDPMTLMEQAI